MKPVINIDWSEKASKLKEKIGLQEAAYKCGVAEYTYRRIMNGSKPTVDYDCGVLIQWYLKRGGK